MLITMARDKQKVVKNVIAWRKRTKQKLVEHKGGCCEICGYNKCIEALEFHHKDPDQKDFSLSGKSWALDRLIEEANKCLMLCANCHREVHAGLPTYHR